MRQEIIRNSLISHHARERGWTDRTLDQIREQRTSNIVSAFISSQVDDQVLRLRFIECIECRFQKALPIPFIVVERPGWHSQITDVRSNVCKRPRRTHLVA